MEEYFKVWEQMEYSEKETLLIGGNFNIKIGKEWRLVDSAEEVVRKGIRTSKDKVLGNRGRKMLEFFNKNGCTVANWNMEGY